jgi:hypothetical protein
VVAERQHNQRSDEILAGFRQTSGESNEEEVGIGIPNYDLVETFGQVKVTMATKRPVKKAKRTAGGRIRHVSFSEPGAERPLELEPDIEDLPLDEGLPRAEPHPVGPPAGRLIVKRNGHSITRQIPKPVVLIDTRERAPLSFSRFPNWIAGEKRKTLRVGDYSVEGMEHLLIVERKSLTDLITTLMQQRSRFFEMCEKLTKYRWRALLVEASYEDVKTEYGADLNTSAHPNAVSGSLDALEAKFGIPVIYTSQYRPLAEEKAASWLSKHFTYWHLEQSGLGRVLQEGDL